jgi:hypothetical protein
VSVVRRRRRRRRRRREEKRWLLAREQEIVSIQMPSSTFRLQRRCVVTCGEGRVKERGGLTRGCDRVQGARGRVAGTWLIPNGVRDRGRRGAPGSARSLFSPLASSHAPFCWAASVRWWRSRTPPSRPLDRGHLPAAAPPTARRPTRRRASRRGEPSRARAPRCERFEDKFCFLFLLFSHQKSKNV